MTLKQRRTQARQNGAKAAGTKSPAGLQKSSMNSTRHGLTAKTLVLSNESPEAFAELLEYHIAKFLPQDEVEQDLIDEMVASLWRLRRMRTL